MLGENPQSPPPRSVLLTLDKLSLKKGWNVDAYLVSADSREIRPLPDLQEDISVLSTIPTYFCPSSLAARAFSLVCDIAHTSSWKSDSCARRTDPKWHFGILHLIISSASAPKEKIARENSHYQDANSLRRSTLGAEIWEGDESGSSLNGPDLFTDLLSCRIPYQKPSCTECLALIQ